MVIIAKDAEDDTLTATFSRPPVTILLKPFLDIHIHSRVNFYAKKTVAKVFSIPLVGSNKACTRRLTLLSFSDLFKVRQAPSNLLLAGGP